MQISFPALIIFTISILFDMSFIILQKVFSGTAEWQIGYAADCKSVYLGSTPGSASKYLHHYQLTCLVSTPDARVVKLVDTRDLKSLASNSVPVQVRPRAPFLE